MNATITIKNDEILTAIKEYIERHGWSAAGSVRLTHSTDRDRGMESTTYSASIDVKPKKAEPQYP